MVVDINKVGLTNVDMKKIHMVPLDVISGYQIRPGLYEINGATADRKSVV